MDRVEPTCDGVDGDATVMAIPPGDDFAADATLLPLPRNDAPDGDATVVSIGIGRDAPMVPAAGVQQAAAPASPAPRGEKLDHADALTPGHELLWYKVERVLGIGGFGITYKAMDTKLNTAVAIKEYLPTTLMSRAPDLRVVPKAERYRAVFEQGRDGFLEEARTLAKFKHANIVRVLTYFEQHDTAYMVMEYEEGESLSSKIKAQGKLSEAEVISIIMPLLQGLMALHEAGFIHRDIKPDNVFVRTKDGSPVLLDFGAARRIGSDEKVVPILTPHYAPVEQYSEDGYRQGPWTDIYAMAALMYHAITGSKPPQAPQRSEAVMRGQPDPLQPAVDSGDVTFTPGFLKAIDLGLAISEIERPKSIKEWLETVEAQSEGGSALNVRNLMKEEEDTALSPKARLAIAAGAIVTVGVLGFASISMLTHRDVDPAVLEAQRLEQEVSDLRARSAAGDAQAMYQLGEHYQKGLGVPADRNAALSWFRKAADGGSLSGRYKIGLAYFEGDGLPRDDTQAIAWFRNGAEGGDPLSQYRYALALEAGLGTKADAGQALEYYKKAAGQRVAEAQYRVGLAYELGEGGTKDDRLAIKSYIEAAQSGHARARLRLGSFFITGRGTQRDLAQGLDWYHKAAEQGLAEAQYLYGLYLRAGEGVNQNFPEAARWLQAAAEQGHAEAQMELASFFEKGVGTTRDPLQAIKWYEKAAEQRVVPAQLKLASIYYVGDVVAQDYVKAAKWLRSAAELGSAEAQNGIGTLYREGNGVSRDYIEALKWFRKSAEQGYPDGQYNFGAAHEQGQGTNKSLAEAIGWYQKAAAQGHLASQRSLGWMFEEGKGVAQDNRRAAQWYALAAEQGDKQAQNTLGWMYEEGRGVKQDLVRAYTWYSLAAAQDHPEAMRNLGLLGRRLGEEQRRQSQQLARAWLESRPKEAAKAEGKEGNKEEAKEPVKEASKEGGKEPGKEPDKQPSTKEPGKS